MPKMNMANFQAILYIPLILGLIVLSGVALRWSLADVYAAQVRHHLNTVNERSTNKNAEQWRVARQHLERTLALRPAYGGYFELAENFYQTLDSLESGRSPLIRELAWRNNEPKALDYARRGLRLTPSWPYLWRKLTLSKLTLKQFDDELTSSFERAVHLGAWERMIQYDMAIMGLNYWPMLADTVRPHVLQAIGQTWSMGKMKSSKRYDVNQLLLHPHFSQACEKQVNNHPCQFIRGN